ncbi:MAG: MBOAT family protein, partial [Candidatus Electrothrix sp. ATG2]|nr:MBOAT family protein [Candidatus Electrothrix sp. ATG2]
MSWFLKYIMIFTSFDYVVFLVIVFLLYWRLNNRRLQNILLLLGSYFFYGYVHPVFCLLIAGLTSVNFFCGIGMRRYEKKRKIFLVISLVISLGVLGFFKYYNFFIDNISYTLMLIGLNFNPNELVVFLPVGISFYTFQALSYTIDVYRKELAPRTNFIDFALFVSFFPQLVAGPIERAKRLLPQIETARVWDSSLFASAWPLLIRGYLKKMVIADNIAIYVNKVYMLKQPSLLLFVACTVGFAIQIYAAFSS